MTSRFLPAAMFVAAGLTGIVLSGCGPRSDRPVLAPVSGKVTYKDKPVAKAQVVFHPEKDGVRAGLGETDAEGRFTLWTYDPGDGAPVGMNKVTITLRGPAEKGDLHPSVRPKGKEMGEAYYEQVGQMAGKPLLPEKYFTIATSGLTADVKAGQKNVFDFALTGEVGKR